MKTTLSLLIMLSLVSLSLNTQAEDQLSFSETIETFGAVYSGKRAGANNTAAELRFRPKITLTTADSLIINLETDFRLDSYIQPGPPERFVTENNHRSLANIREGYIEYGQDLKFRIGKQLFNWCTTDTICPNDNLAPKDWNDILRPERISLIALDAKYGTDNFLEVVLTPWLVPTKLPENKTRWSNELPTSLIMSDDYLGKHNQFQLGVRGNLNIESLDLGATYFHGYSNSPRLIIQATSPTELQLIPEYYLEDVFGLSLSKNVGNYGFRLEAGYFSQQGADNFLQYVIGLDREWTNVFNETDNFYCLLQYGNEAILDHNSAKQLDMRRVLNNALLSRLRYTFSDSSRWSFTLENSFNLGQHDSYLEPSLVYKGSDYEIKAGLDLLFGTKDTFFGSYRDNNRLFTLLTVHF